MSQSWCYCKCADGPWAGCWYLGDAFHLRHGMPVVGEGGQATGRYLCLESPTILGGHEVYMARYKAGI